MPKNCIYCGDQIYFFNPHIEISNNDWYCNEHCMSRHANKKSDDARYLKEKLTKKAQEINE